MCFRTRPQPESTLVRLARPNVGQRGGSVNADRWRWCRAYAAPRWKGVMRDVAASSRAGVLLFAVRLLSALRATALVQRTGASRSGAVYPHIKPCQYQRSDSRVDKPNVALPSRFSAAAYPAVGLLEGCDEGWQTVSPCVRRHAAEQSRRGQASVLIRDVRARVALAFSLQPAQTRRLPFRIKHVKAT